MGIKTALRKNKLCCVALVVVLLLGLLSGIVAQIQSNGFLTYIAPSLSKIWSPDFFTYIASLHNEFQSNDLATYIASQYNLVESNDLTAKVVGMRDVLIKGHKVSLSDGNIEGILNITLISSLSEIEVKCHMLLADPSGRIVYDNFMGIGGPPDKKLCTVYNDSITSVHFSYSLTYPRAGVYTYVFSIWSSDEWILYDSTNWLYAFLYTPSVLSKTDLGNLSSNSHVSTSPSLTMKRLDSVIYSFTLLKNVTYLSINSNASANSRLLVTLNQSDLIAENELRFIDESTAWTLFNIPSGTYDLTVTALSDTAYLLDVSIEAGDNIEASGVLITSVEATSESSTPEGTMNYHITVMWNTTLSDVLNVTAQFQGSIVDSLLYEIFPLFGNQRDFYLTVEAPETVGNYTVDFTARLQEAGVQSQSSSQLVVRISEYNITLVNRVQYYKVHTLWSYLLTGKKYEYFDDPSQLSALSVTKINVTNIDEFYDDGKPKSATIVFNATNKLTGEIAESLKFGEGVHYEVAIRTGSDQVTLAILLAGDSEIVRASKVPIDENGVLNFEIVYSQWIYGGILELGAHILQSAISLIPEGGAVINFIVDIAKLAMLYTGKIWFQFDQGYLSKQDMISLLESIGIKATPAILKLADKYLGISPNAFFSLTSIVFYEYSMKKISLATLIYASVKFALIVTGKAIAKIADTIHRATVMAFKKYGVTLTTNINEHVNAKDVLRFFNIILSFSEAIVTIWRYFTSPAQEGKVISGAEIGTEPAIQVDPLITVAFNGSPSDANITYFGDIYGIEANITVNKGRLAFLVESNLTSTFLPVFSDPIFRCKLFSGYGFNATDTSLDWQESSNRFIIEGIGSMYLGLQQMSFTLNSTLIQGYQQMSVDAMRNGTTALLNCSLTYPFGNNLTYLTEVTLPPGSTNIEVLSGGNYTIKGTTITWAEPVDHITVRFTPFLGDLNGDGVVDSTDLGILGMAWGSVIGEANYIPEADLNGDGVVDSTDLGILGVYWGEIA